jgi:hypothetical protein
MPNGQLTPITLEGVRIAFRNFSGKEGQYNREGDRNFAAILPADIAEDMRRDGWNIKQLRPREEGDDPQDYIQVSVGFKGRPPRIVMITSRGRTTLGEDEVNILDWAEIANVDLILQPYEWTVNGKSGVKAYLKSIFVTIEEDDLERKYADVPDSARSAVDTPDLRRLVDIWSVVVGVVLALVSVNIGYAMGTSKKNEN